MVRTFTTALLLAGMAASVSHAGAPPQPEPKPQQKHNSEVYVLSPSPGSRSYLGVDIRDITQDRVGPLKLKEERGVEITMVDADAPAGKAGLKEHDVILEFNGTAVESEEQIRRLIREVPPGRTVTLGISRDGNPMKISVQLADHSTVVAQARPHVFVPAPRVQVFPRNGMDLPFQIQTYSSVLGVQTESLTRQLAEYF